MCAVLAFPVMAGESDTEHDAVRRRVVQLRKAMGFTQATMGRLCGMNATTWNNYEKGVRRISIDMAIKLCQTTGVTMDFIYRGEMRGLQHDLVLKLQGEGGPQRRRPA